MSKENNNQIKKEFNIKVLHTKDQKDEQFINEQNSCQEIKYRIIRAANIQLAYRKYQEDIELCELCGETMPVAREMVSINTPKV